MWGTRHWACAGALAIMSCAGCASSGSVIELSPPGPFDEIAGAWRPDIKAYLTTHEDLEQLHMVNAAMLHAWPVLMRISAAGEYSMSHPPETLGTLTRFDAGEGWILEGESSTMPLFVMRDPQTLMVTVIPDGTEAGRTPYRRVFDPDDIVTGAWRGTDAPGLALTVQADGTTSLQAARRTVKGRLRLIPDRADEERDVTRWALHQGQEQGARALLTVEAERAHLEFNGTRSAVERHDRPRDPILVLAGSWELDEQAIRDDIVLQRIPGGVEKALQQRSTIFGPTLDFTPEILIAFRDVLEPIGGDMFVMNDPAGGEVGAVMWILDRDRFQFCSGRAVYPYRRVTGDDE